MTNESRRTSLRWMALVRLMVAGAGLAMTAGHTADAATISSSSTAQVTYDAIWPSVQGESQGGTGIISSTASALLATTYLGGTVDADASASGNLASGDIAVSDGAFLLGDVHLTANTVGGTGYSGSAARAFANIAEILNVVPTAGFSSGTFDATVTVVLDGTLSGHSYASTNLSASSFVASDSTFASACSGTLAECAGLASTVVPFTLNLTIPVATSFPFLSVDLLSSVGANWEGGDLGNPFPLPVESGSADLQNTGLLYVTLPEGFTFTSEIAQGVLTPVSPVPEPTSLALFATGLMGLRTMRKYRAGRR